jgi:hypothetical protein
MDAEWHFFAASHGKGACVGTGGTIRRLARRASLQNLFEEQIMALRQLREWAVLKITSVTFEYCTTEDHSKQVMFEERFRKAQTVPDTREIHCIILIPNKQFRQKCLSKHGQHHTHIYNTLVR